MRFCTLLSIVVCCTIKVHTAPLQKRDVETNSEKGNSEIDNLKQQASSTFSNLPGKNNNANKPNNIGQWVKGVPSKWPVKTKANNGGKPNGKQTSNKKLKEKTNQLDEDEMTGNMFEEPETEGDTVAKVEQDGSEMPREESVDNNQENNANNKKNNSTKKKKKNTRKNYPTMVQNPLYIGGLLGFPHENMDNEGITTHTEVWKWNDGEEVVLINDVNPKSSNQKSNSDNVFLREKRNFDEKNIPFVAEFVPKDYQHANLYSETQTPKKNIEENENYGSTKSLTGNDDYEKDNAQLRNELDDDSVTISPEEQDSLIPQSELKESPKDLQLKESFFEFNKEHINNELTKIESKTTPFSTLSNNHDDDVYRNNIKKKIIKRLVPKINLTKPNEKINAIENDDESLQHNFNNDESINSKDSIPTEHSTNDNIQTNKMRNIESNRNPGPDQLLQSDKIRNGLGNRQFFDKKDRTTANLDEKEKSDELPSSSTKNEISDKLQNTNKDNLDEDELKNNNLFSSDDFFLDGSILDTDDKNNVNVSYLNETLDNPDDKNKMNDVSLKPNDNSRLELSSFESNEVNKIPQTDTAYTDNYEKNHNLNITPQNDDNTNYVQYLDETPNIPVEDPKLESLSLNQPKIPLHNLQSHVSNDKNKNMIILNKDKLNNNDYISYKNDLNKPNENNLTNGLTFNENPISNIESSNQVSKEENQKNPQYGSKTNNDASNNPSKDMKPTENNVLPSNSWIDNDNFFDKADKTDLEMKDRAPFIEETSAIPIENDISHGLSKNPKHDDQTNLSELNNNQDDIKPNIHDVLLLDQLFINDNKLKLEDNDKDTPQLKDETFNKPDENVVPNGMLIYGEPNPNFHSPNNVYEQGNGEYPQPDDYKSKKTNNSYPDNIAPIKNDILSLNNILGDNLVSDNDKSNQQINDEDTAQLNEKTSNSSDENVIPNGLAFKDQPNRNIQLSNQQEISTYPQYGNNTNNDVSNDPLDDMKPKENPWKSWFGYGNLFSAKDDSKMGVNDKLESPLLKQPLDSSNKEGILNGLPIIEKPDPIQTNKVIINNNPVDIEPMENDVFSFNDILSDDNLFGEDDKQDMETNDKDAIKLKEETLDKPDRNDNLNDLPFNKRPIPNIESPNHVYDNDNTADSQPDNHASKNPINSYPDDIEPMENDVLSFNDILSDDNLFGEDDKSDVEINDKDAIKLKEDTLDKPDRNDNINDLPFNEGPILNIESPNYVNNNDNTADSQPDSYASKNPINSYPDGIEPMENDVLSFNDILSDDNLFGEDDKSDVEINDKDAIKLKEDTLDKPNRNDNLNDLPFNERPIPNIESPNLGYDKDYSADSQPDNYASKNPINSYPDDIEPMENDVLSFNDILSDDNLFGEDDKSDVEINEKNAIKLNEDTLDKPDRNDNLNDLPLNEGTIPNIESPNHVYNNDNTADSQPDNYASKNPINSYPDDIEPMENDVLSFNDILSNDNLFREDDKSNLQINDEDTAQLNEKTSNSSDENVIPNGLAFNEQLNQNNESSNYVSNEDNKKNPQYGSNKNNDVSNDPLGDMKPKENPWKSWFGYGNLFSAKDDSKMGVNDKLESPLLKQPLDSSNKEGILNGLPIIEKPDPIQTNKVIINNNPGDIEPMENDVFSFNDILSDDNLFGEDDKQDMETNDKDAIKLKEETLDKSDRNDNINDLPFNKRPIPNIESPNHVYDNDNTADSQPDNHASKNPINSYPDDIEPMENDVLSFNDILSDDNLFGEDDKSDVEINEKNAIKLNEDTLDKPDRNDNLNDLPLNEGTIPNIESPNHVYNNDNTADSQPDNYASKNPINSYPDDIEPMENDVLSFNDILSDDNLFGEDDKSDVEINDKDAIKLKEDTLDKPDRNDNINDLPFNEGPILNIESPNYVNNNDNTADSQPDSYASKNPINSYPDGIEPMENDVLSFNDILSDDNLFGEDDKSDVEINEKNAIKLNEDTLDKPDRNDNLNDLPLNEGTIPNIESPNHVYNNDNTADSQPDNYASKNPINSYPDDIEPMENDVLSFNDILSNDNLFREDDKSNLQINDEDTAQLNEKTSNSSDENVIPNGLAFNEQLNQNNESSNYVSNEDSKKNPQYGSNKNNDVSNDPLDDMKPKENPWKSWFGYGNLFSAKDDSKMGVNDKLESPLLKQPLDSSNKEGILNGLPIIEKPDPIQTNKVIINNNPGDIEPMENDVFSFNDILSDDNLFGEDDKQDMETNDKDAIKLKEETLDKPDRNDNLNDLPFNKRPIPNIESPNHVYDNDNTADSQPDNHASKNPINSYPDDIEPMENDVLSFNDILSDDNLFGEDDKSDVEINEKDAIKLKEDTLDKPDRNDNINDLPFNEGPILNIESPNYVNNNDNTADSQPDSYASKNPINSYPDGIEPMENDVLSFNDILSDDNLFGEDDKSDVEINDKDAIKLKEDTLDNPDRNDNLNDLPFNERPIPNIESPNLGYDNDYSADSQPDNYASKNPINSYPDDIEPMENDVLSFNDILSDDNLFGEDDKSDVEINDKDANKLKEDTLDKPDRNDNINDLPFNEGPILNIESPNYVNNNDNTADSQPDSYASKNPINSYPDGIEPMENDVLSFNDILSDDNLFGEDDKSDVEINDKDAIKLKEDTLDKPNRNDNLNDLPFNERPIPNIESPNLGYDKDYSADSQPDNYASMNPINSYPDDIEPMENDVLSFNDILSDDNLFGEDDKSNLQINDEDTAQLNEKTSNSSDENDEQLNQNNESSNYVSNEDSKKNPQYGINKNNDVSNDPLDDIKPKENPWKSWFGYGNLFSSKNDSKMGVNDKLESPLLKQPLDSSNKEGILNGLPIIEKPNPIQTNKVIINNNPDDIEPMENDVLSFNDILSDDNLFGEDNKSDVVINDKDAIKLKEDTLDKPDRNDNINDLPLNEGPIPNIEPPNHVYYNDNTADSQPDNYASKNPINSYPDDIEPMENDVLSFNDILNIRPNIQPHIIKKKPKIDQPIDGTENNGFNLNLNSDNIGDINNQLNAKNSTKLYKPDSNINIISDIKKPDPNHINYSNKGFYSAEIVEKPKKKGATKNNNSLDLHSTQDVSEFKKKPKSRQKPTKFYDSSPEDDVSSLQVKKNKKTASGTYENPNYTIVLPNTPPVINISPEATPVPSNLDSIFNSSILDKYDLYPKDFWKFMLQNPNIYNQSKNSHLNQNSNELPTHKLKNPIGDGNKNNPNINTVDIFDGTNPELHNIKKSDGTFRPFTPNRYNNDLPAQRKSNKGKTNYFNINTYLSQPTPTDKNSVNSIPPVDSSTNLLDKSQDSIQNYGSKNNKANSNAADDDSKTMKNMNQSNDQNQLYDSFFKALTDRLLNHIDTAIDSKLSQQGDNIRNNQKPDDKNEDSSKDYQTEPQTLKNMKSSHNKKVISKNKIASKVDRESEENSASSDEYAADNNIKRKAKKTKKTKKLVSSDESDIDESVEEVYKKKKTKNNTGKSGKTKVVKKKTTKSKNSKKKNSPSSKRKNVKSKKSKVSTKKKTTKSKKKSNSVKSTKGKSNKTKKVKKKRSSIRKKSKNNKIGSKGQKKKTNKNVVKKKKVTYYVDEDVSSPYSKGNTYALSGKNGITRYVVREAPKTEIPKYVIKKPTCIECEKKSHHHKCSHAKNKHRNKPDDPVYMNYGYGYSYW